MTNRTDAPRRRDRAGVGIIGCGIGKWHLEGFGRDRRADIIAIAGIDVDRCQELAHAANVPNVYADYRQMLERQDIEAVSVAVPNHLHVPVGMDAIVAGKHVLMEKPIARNAEEGEMLLNAAEEAGLVLGVIFNRRARSDTALLQSQVAAGVLGRIYHAKAFWRRRSGVPGLGTWFTTKSQAGGGPLIDLGVHVLDMALWSMGEPRITTVSAATYSELGPQGLGHWSGNRFSQGSPANFDVEDFATAFMRTSDGATIALETSWAAHTSDSDEFGVYLLGTKAGAELHVKDYATQGTLRFFSTIDGIPVDSQPRLSEKPPAAGHAEVISAFLDAILHGTPMLPSGYEGLQRTRIIDAIYRSAAEGREIELDADPARKDKDGHSRENLERVST
jgi:predicted dehydrogenase